MKSATHVFGSKRSPSAPCKHAPRARQSSCIHHEEMKTHRTLSSFQNARGGLEFIAHIAQKKPLYTHIHQRHINDTATARVCSAAYALPCSPRRWRGASRSWSPPARASAPPLAPPSPSTESAPARPGWRPPTIAPLGTPRGSEPPAVIVRDDARKLAGFEIDCRTDDTEGTPFETELGRTLAVAFVFA